MPVLVHLSIQPYYVCKIHWGITHGWDHVSAFSLLFSQRQFLCELYITYTIGIVIVIVIMIVISDSDSDSDSDSHIDSDSDS